MEKNMLVKYVDSSMFHVEATVQDGNGMINRVAFIEFQKPNVIKGKKYDALDVVHFLKIDSK